MTVAFPSSADGERQTPRARNLADGAPIGREASAFDDARPVEDALRDRERELSQLVDMVPSHVWRLTPEGEPTFFNGRMAEYLGLEVADTERPGKSRLAAMIEMAVHPDDRVAVSETLGRSLATGEGFAIRYRLRRKDGVYRWMSSRAEPMRDGQGRILHWYGICHDIHDQMQAEGAVRESEQRLQAMIDAVPVRIWSAASPRGPIYFNKRYQDDLRSVFTDPEASLQPDMERFVRELVHPDDSATVLGTLGQCFETGAPAVMRFRWREQDGDYRWAECRVEPRREADGSVVQWYGASIDIDDQVRAQEGLRRASDQLARAAQAASLAEVSASIAHEVNQPLAAIVANSYACEHWLSADPPNLERAKSTVARITRDANAASDVVGRIRALFNHAPQARAAEDVNRLIGEVCRLMADEVGAREVRLDVDLEADLPAVLLDRVQVQQVLVNLIRNGLEAMEGVTDRPRMIEIRSRREGAAVRIAVGDSGVGLKEAERAFEPFFTTKPNGMGMGLAICRSIIESHDGRLSVADNDGHGAVASFTLPLTGPA